MRSTSYTQLTVVAIIVMFTLGVLIFRPQNENGKVDEKTTATASAPLTVIESNPAAHLQVRYDMTPYLSFLDPNIVKCEQMFSLGKSAKNNMSEIQHIWDELKQHDAFIEKTVSTMTPEAKKNCREGYSSRYQAEGYVMAKLAR